MSFPTTPPTWPIAICRPPTSRRRNPLAKLSIGKRVVSARDDAASMAIDSRMQSEVMGLIDAYGHASATLPPAQQIVLLYEGAIRRLRAARSATVARRINQRCCAVQKATAIIDGLQSCLDHERGGELGRNLDRIYTHITFRLQRVT